MFQSFEPFAPQPANPYYQPPTPQVAPQAYPYAQPVQYGAPIQYVYVYVPYPAPAFAGGPANGPEGIGTFGNGRSPEGYGGRPKGPEGYGGPGKGRSPEGDIERGPKPEGYAGGEGYGGSKRNNKETN